MSDEQLRRERELYRRLLDLDAQQELAPLLREALALIVDVTHARLGYLELHDEHDGADGPRWSAEHGMTEEEVAGARVAISRGIVGEALATGQTIMTPSAWLDPRFHERQSVQVARIEAVLCVPVGTENPLGILYLQGAGGEGPFSEEDCATAELFARHLAPLADRLLIRVQSDGDPTRSIRDKLKVQGVIGKTPALADLLQHVALVAPLDVSVLLTGESGTGKTQIARVIHDNSPRASHPFIELNCAALPEALIESELFGALPGAHSTATRKIDGKIAGAERGTLFLDEIGDLSLPAQAKLLQLLQSKEYFPLGATKATRADVRILAASNVDLQAAVVERRFRQDLLYRLQVVPIHVPSLAQRKEDVGILASFFCLDACRSHGLPQLEMSRAALKAAEAAEWPGNVRQLAHAVEAGAIRAAGQDSARLELQHLFPGVPGSSQGPQRLTFQEATRRFQADIVLEALKEADWNVVQVAERLDLTRSHVYNLIKAFGLKR